MMWHPLALSILVIDALALLFIFKSALSAVRVAVDWSPGSPTEGQIALETAAETGALSGRAAFGLLALSTLLLVAAVTNVFPGLVPGAMCGTGVLQATRGTGAQAFWYKILGLGLLYIWFLLDRLDRTAPDAPLARRNAKLLLLAAPVAAISVVTTFNALTHLDTHAPVDCCAVVYDQFSGLPIIAPAAGLQSHQLVWSFGLLTGILACTGVIGPVLPGRWFGVVSGAAAAASPMWGLLSALVLVRVLSAYIYEVLHHQCPWCLFLPEHHYIGFLLFGLLVLAVLQGPAAYAYYRAAAHPEVAQKGGRLARRSLAAMTFFILAFTAVAVWPAISWKLRYGVWMM